MRDVMYKFSEDDVKGIVIRLLALLIICTGITGCTEISDENEMSSTNTDMAAQTTPSNSEEPLDEEDVIMNEERAFIDEKIELGIRVQVAADILNVRSAPSFQGEILSQVYEGDEFIIMDVNEEVPAQVWLKIEYGDGNEGWIAAWFCNVIDERVLRLLESVYIGEAFPSGDIYLQPLIETVSVSQDDQTKSILFYSLETGECYQSEAVSLFQCYVPDLEEESRFYNRPFSMPQYIGYLYKAEGIEETTFGITYLNGGANISLTNRDVARIANPNEIESAQVEVEADNVIPEESRTLTGISLEDTIISAKNVCYLEVEDSLYDLNISYYFTHSFEYVYDVYVIDVVYNDSVIGTWESFIGDGPY